MQNRPSITTLQILVLLGISFFASAVHAFQMGEVSAQSRIGEPLNATVGLWLSPKDQLKPVRFKIDPDLSYISNSKLTALVKRMEASLVQNPNGSSYVSIKTTGPIAEPIVAFRLKMYVGDEARMRNFALALTPPSIAKRAQASADQKPMSRSRPRQSAKRSSINGPSYTVASGDTLWGIARRLGRTNGAAIAKLVQQIFAANPHAFVNGNQDQVMLGARLNLPVAEAPSDAAPAAIESPPAPTAQIESTRVTTAAAEPSATGTQAIAAAATHSPVRWQDRNPELAAELETLRQKYAAIRSRYDLQSALPQTGDIAPASPTVDAAETFVPSSEPARPTVIEILAVTDLQAVDDSPTVAPTAPPITEQLQSEPPTTSASSAEQTVTSGGFGMAVFLQSLNTFWASIPFYTIFVTLFALVAIAGLLRAMHRVVTTRSSRRAAQNHAALEEYRRAEVARKAKNQIKMETEIRRMLDERDKGAATSAPEQPAAVPSAETETGQSIEATIDINIAHGRYAEAETLLTKVITSTPRNYSAKLRLIEVFYMTEQIEEFCALAEDLHQNHRSDMADEEWRRVIRMGKIVAPDRAPFSGPRAVENPTQAS